MENMHPQTCLLCLESGLLLMEQENTDLLCLDFFFFVSGNGGCKCCVYNFVHSKGTGLDQ